MSGSVNQLFTDSFVPEMKTVSQAGQTPTVRDVGALHTPVLLAEMLAALQPRDGGIYLDGTFGAGGYTRAILQAAECHVIAIDRDPDAIFAARPMEIEFVGRLTLMQERFGNMQKALQDAGIEGVDGVVLDIGVSSMQIDTAERGFSFLRDGPLDMRMSQVGKSAADYVNSLKQEDLANVIFVYGEERKSRAIARAIVAARDVAPIVSTHGLVAAIERAVGRQKPHEKTHPATRTFQALRILVNAELDELADALFGAEHILRVGGRLVVVTFHSLEDRVVKRFFALRSGKGPGQSRFQPVLHEAKSSSFELTDKGPVVAGEEEIARNPRARSAKLRAGVRLDAPAWARDPDSLGIAGEGGVLAR